MDHSPLGRPCGRCRLESVPHECRHPSAHHFVRCLPSDAVDHDQSQSGDDAWKELRVRRLQLIACLHTRCSWRQTLLRWSLYLREGDGTAATGHCVDPEPPSGAEECSRYYGTIRFGLVVTKKDVGISSARWDWAFDTTDNRIKTDLFFPELYDRRRYNVVPLHYFLLSEALGPRQSA
jgi:hypothetical protein